MTAPPDIAALVERLRDESDLCANDGATDIVKLLDEAADALGAAARDAARYRWLRDPQNADESGYPASLWGEHMDAAIDRARGEP